MQPFSQDPADPTRQPAFYAQSGQSSELPPPGGTDGPWQQQPQTNPGYAPQQPMSQPQQGNPWQQQPQTNAGYAPQQQPMSQPQQGNPWQQQPQTNAGYAPQQQQSMYQPQANGGYLPQPMYQPAMPVTSVNVNVNTQQKNSGCVRAIYFVFIGWWLGFWCLQFGFLLCLFIVTLPFGLMILNRIPQIMTLKSPTQTVQTNVNVSAAGVNVNVNVTGVRQHPIILRAIYYIFVGCWAGYLWASLGYFFCLTIFGLPLGILMLNQLPVVLTLRKN